MFIKKKKKKRPSHFLPAFLIGTTVYATRVRYSLPVPLTETPRDPQIRKSKNAFTSLSIISILNLLHFLGLGIQLELSSTLKLGAMKLYLSGSQTQRAAIAGLFVLLLPLLQPNLFAPLGRASPSMFSVCHFFISL